MKVKIFSSLIVLLLVLSPLGFAQPKETAAIVGTVVDEEGTPLPGVAVTLSSPNIMGERTAITDVKGQYRFPALSPGLYSVKAELDGFGTTVQKNVRFFTTTRLTVDLTLKMTAMLEERPQQEKKETKVVAKKRIEFKTSDLFDQNKVRFVRALKGEKEIEISKMGDLQRVAEGSVLVAKLNMDAEIKPLGAGRAKISLPYRLNIAVSGAPPAMNLVPEAVLEQGGLRFDPQYNHFKGSVLIGIKDEDAPDEKEDLPVSIIFQFVFNAGPVIPISLIINHTNLPYERINLTATGLQVSPKLKILSSFDTSGVEVDIPVLRPMIELRAPSKIPGLGFGYGKVSVTLSPELIGKIEEVALDINQGYLDPNPLPLSSSGIGVTELRSTGLGRAKIEIVGEHFDCPPVYVHFTWPLVFSILIVLGAIVSGALFASSEGKFWVGFLLGVVASIAYGAGINLLDIDLGKYYTEIVAFVAAALPGFLRVSSDKIGLRKKK